MQQLDEFIIKSGKCFIRPIVVFGYNIIAVGVIATLLLLMHNGPFHSLFGLLAILVGCYLSFNKSGLQIKDKKYRRFCYLFKWKIGKWQEPKHPYITILKKRLQQQTYGGRTTIALSDTYSVYEITLLSESHRTKLPILRLKDLEKAQVALESISKLLDVEICQYNPKTTRRR